MKRKAGVSPPDDEKSKTSSGSKVYLVQGENFRCLACVDKDGKWINLFTKERLPKVTQVKPVV